MFDFAVTGRPLATLREYERRECRNSPIAAGLTHSTSTSRRHLQRDAARPTDLRTVPGNQPGEQLDAVHRLPSAPQAKRQYGEVEDYQWSFGPNAVTLSGMTASSAASPLALPLGLVTHPGPPGRWHRARTTAYLAPSQTDRAAGLPADAGAAQLVLGSAAQVLPFKQSLCGCFCTRAARPSQSQTSIIGHPPLLARNCVMPTHHDLNALRRSTPRSTSAQTAR